MKLLCDIVQDLLPLYEDELCSSASREAVEEHLRKCPDCRAKYERVRGLAVPEAAVLVSNEDQAMVKGFRRVRRRFTVSLIAVLLAVPLILLTVNQARGSGICFTNLDEIRVAGTYIRALEDGDFEKAASFMDYEGLYEEVQEFLSMEPEDFIGDYVTVTIDGEEWVAKAYFYRKYLQYEDDAESIWSYLFYNRIPGVMLPENTWNELAAGEPDSVTEDDGELLLNGNVYLALETPWGTYIVQQDSGLKECTTAAEYCAILDLMPMKIYEEARPELEAEALEQYQYTQEYYSRAADMTIGEFTDFVQAYYVKKLKNCTEWGFQFQSSGYKSSCRMQGGGYWNIEYGVQITYEGKTYPAVLIFLIQDGKITAISRGYGDDFAALEESDALLEALAVRYPHECGRKLQMFDFYRCNKIIRLISAFSTGIRGDSRKNVL